MGLGLSASREIARAHGGDITLRAESSGICPVSFAPGFEFSPRRNIDAVLSPDWASAEIPLSTEITPQ